MTPTGGRPPPLWLSYDDGETWRERPARAGGAAGEYGFVLDSRNADGNTGYVSLRVEAWDADGNSIEQEVIRAWRLADR